MEWILLGVGIVIILWLITKSKKKGTVNNHDDEMELLETRGNEHFFEALDEAKKRVQELKVSLHNKSNIFGTEENVKSYLKDAEEEVMNLNNTREAFIRLKEAIKFRPLSERMELFHDWQDYGVALFSSETKRKQWDLGIAEDTEYLRREGREIHLQIEEIEKRFQQRLKRL